MVSQIAAEKFLKNSSFSMEEMVNSTPSCMKIINREGQLLSMNSKGLALIEAEDMESVRGANVYDIVEESHRERFREFNEKICSGQKGTLVFEIVGLQGARRWMETHAAPYYLANGEVAHIAITNDITDKVVAEKELLQQRQALASSARLASIGQFVGGIAHEINNPLSIIHGKLTMLKLKREIGELEGEYFESSLNVLLKTTERISGIIQNLKMFSRDSEFDPFNGYNLVEIIDETLSLCRENFRLNNVEIKTVIDETICIKCQKLQISQVLMNLLNNAFDAVNEYEEKWVKLETIKSDEHIQLLVTDSGKGIPREIADQMLNPFFTTKEIGKGTGLGLSLSARIIDHHNGRLFYNSEHPNTQFIVELPA